MSDLNKEVVEKVTGEVVETVANEVVKADSAWNKGTVTVGLLAVAGVLWVAEKGYKVGKKIIAGAKAKKEEAVAKKVAVKAMNSEADDEFDEIIEDLDEE